MIPQDKNGQPFGVLFVCTGNICRSPTAEGVFRDLVTKAGMEDLFHIDSAGTGGWHQGDPPDHRSVVTARNRGVDISGLRARQLIADDYSVFHMLIALDRSHLEHMQAYKPANSSARMSLLMSHADIKIMDDVPDPYYGGASDFEKAYDLIEAGAEGLFAKLRRQIEGNL